MILTLDIGNTNIKTALFDGKEMRYYWRMSTRPRSSAWRASLARPSSTASCW